LLDSAKELFGFLDLLERDGRARVLLSTPARKCLQPRSPWEEGVSRTPRRRAAAASAYRPKCDWHHSLLPLFAL